MLQHVCCYLTTLQLTNLYVSKTIKKKQQKTLVLNSWSFLLRWHWKINEVQYLYYC